MRTLAHLPDVYSSMEVLDYDVAGSRWRCNADVNRVMVIEPARAMRSPPEYCCGRPSAHRAIGPIEPRDWVRAKRSGVGSRSLVNREDAIASQPDEGIRGFRLIQVLSLSGMTCSNNSSPCFRRRLDCHAEIMTFSAHFSVQFPCEQRARANHYFRKIAAAIPCHGGLLHP